MAKARRGRPIIGITGPRTGGWPAWFCARTQIWLQGGRARRITPKSNFVEDTLDLFDGLIIGGGADINPEMYGESIFKTIKTETRRVVGSRRRWRVRWPLQFFVSVILWLIRRLFSVQMDLALRDKGRDDLEYSLIKAAVRRDMPVLGICRGGQMINVFFGGSLHQDISGFYVEKPNLRTVRARKKVNVVPGTELARITGRDKMRVNSLHHQSVNLLGSNLRVCAVEPNGVVQAIEHTQARFVLGVQWHPEFLPLHREQRRIFHHLVEAAKVHQLSVGFAGATFATK